MSNERSYQLNSFKTFLFQQMFRYCTSFQKHPEKNVLRADPRTPFSDRVTKKNKKKKQRLLHIVFSMHCFQCCCHNISLFKLYRYINNTTINIQPSVTYYKIFYKKLLLRELEPSRSLK